MDKPVNLSGMWERFTHNSYPFYVSHFTHTIHSTKDNTRHFHDYGQLFYLISGNYSHTIGDITYECASGSLTIVPPGVSHFYQIPPDESCEFIMICIMPSFFDKPSSESEINLFAHVFLPSFATELGFTPVSYLECIGDKKEKIEKFFLKLSAYNWTRTINNYSDLKKSFLGIFDSETFSVPEKSVKKISRFAETKYFPLVKTVYYMNINYNKIIHRNELISMSNICQTDYFKLMKKAIGCTYSNYMQMIRVRRAVQMCSFTTYSLSYIADICGFGDLSYMEKRIKKFYPAGQLPSEMKKKRGSYVKVWPFSIKSRSEYEDICKLFYTYGP